MRNCTKSTRRTSTLFRLTALAAAVGSLMAAAPAQAGVDVTVTFTPSALGFTPAPSVYIMSIALGATGFTDDTNLDNFVSLASSNHAFSGDIYPARHIGTGTAGSYGYDSTTALRDAINESETWTLTVTDGVTGITSTYSLNVSTPGIPDDYLRPITIDLASNTPLSPNPVITFSQEPAIDSQAEYTSAYAVLIGAIPGNFYYDPPITPFDTSWSPTSTLIDDVYTFGIVKISDTPDQSLVVADTPQPIDDAPPLESFTVSVTTSTSNQAEGLQVGEPARVAVTAQFSPAVISFSPLTAPVYILGIGLNATGFTDDANLDNFIELRSRTNSFSSDFYPARHTGSGTAGSVGTASADALSALINTESPWTLTITDGVTHRVSTYTLDVTTPGIDADYLRPVTLDVLPGDNISPNPTFNYSQASSSIPSAQFTSAFAFLLGSTHFYGTPAVTPEDTSWSPDTTIEPDTYTFLVIKFNANPPQSLIAATTPVPGESAPPLESFTYAVDIQIDAQSGDLHVAPTCAPDFNQDGTLDPDDLADYIGAYFAQPPGPGSDFNADGTTDPDDLADYIGAFFAGC